MPLLHERCVETWKIHLPDYEIIRWDEENTSIDTPFLRHCLEKKQWAFMSDYIRMRAIHDHGGIYIDTDVEVIKNFDPLLSNACFMGYESIGRATTGVLGGIAGHEFMKQCMEIIDDRHERNLPYLIAPKVAQIAAEKIKTKDLHIYPEAYFYPYNPYDPARPSVGLMYRDIRPETFAIHHWGKSWGKPDGNWARRIIRKLNQFIKTPKTK